MFKTLSEVQNKANGENQKYWIDVLHIKLNIDLELIEKCIPYMEADFYVYLNQWTKTKRDREISYSRPYFTKLLRAYCRNIFDKRLAYNEWFNALPAKEREQEIKIIEDRKNIRAQYEQLKKRN